MSELYAEQKKQDVRKNLIGTLKFGGVAMPLVLLFSAPLYFKAHTQIPIYDQDCLSAKTVYASQSSSVPCYDETANAELKNYYSRTGSIDTQYALLNFPDGRTAQMQIDNEPGTHWTHSQVDGLCSVEVWHGQTTAVLRPGARVLARYNPELDGDTTSMIVGVLAPSILTLVFWTYLFILWKRGELSANREKTLS